MPELPRPTATRRIPIAAGAVVIGALIGFAGVYGIGGLNRNATGDPACRRAVELARKLAPLAHRAVAANTRATAPRRGELERKLDRSEEHTSELQSRLDLVCRLLLEKKKRQQRAPRRRHLGSA